MKDKKQYKRYSTAFKEEAVALVTEQGYSAQQAALLRKVIVSFRKVIFLC
ncbi:hypothetical protein Psal006b_03342 (plasmid) [Piscirickettsia salmonis]|uniref:Transposase n=1 Tax=Piscirickettsia salmonis TaxID=1238 RepID=A0AAC8VL43_PISSA|nr:hypothetical protein [Piscirickettsia salmonis]ALB24500.1 hypothetical protein KU39_3p38 [Piscirickettsia salmonis]QGO00305.1 hypothetical protein Psal006b_03342 [Piscirickettsia salmonis]QGO03948.1 hypothetical protein Psal008_03365 [Piscirickettsia salmonis]QGO14580.1 hypothetical protein Psal010b_03334 [Piscirickettsia salmonis]QGO21677.1 hypothetical protein Psal013_03373 [Piscirickettsia salmonis]